MLMRKSYLSSCDDLKNLPTYINELVGNGFWNILESGTMPNYNGEFEGQIYVCKRLWITKNSLFDYMGNYFV